MELFATARIAFLWRTRALSMTWWTHIFFRLVSRTYSTLALTDIVETHMLVLHREGGLLHSVFTPQRQ